MFRGVVEAQVTEGNVVTTIAPDPQTVHPVVPVNHHADHLAGSTSGVEATLTLVEIQEATVTVAKGYQPKRVIVEAGHPVRLQFDRQNSSSCYDQLLIPDFAIAVDLDHVSPGTVTPNWFSCKGERTADQNNSLLRRVGVAQDLWQNRE
jgi:hypothetical protein